MIARACCAIVLLVACGLAGCVGGDARWRDLEPEEIVYELGGSGIYDIDQRCNYEDDDDLFIAIAGGGGPVSITIEGADDTLDGVSAQASLNGDIDTLHDLGSCEECFTCDCDPPATFGDFVGEGERIAIFVSCDESGDYSLRVEVP